MNRIWSGQPWWVQHKMPSLQWTHHGQRFIPMWLHHFAGERLTGILQGNSLEAKDIHVDKVVVMGKPWTMSSHQTHSQFQQHHGGATLSSTLRGDSVAETFGNIVVVGQQPEVHQVTYSSQTVDQTQIFQPIPLLQTQNTGTFHTAENTPNFDDIGEDFPNAQQLPQDPTHQESMESDSEYSGDTHILDLVVTETSIWCYQIFATTTSRGGRPCSVDTRCRAWGVNQEWSFSCSCNCTRYVCHWFGKRTIYSRGNRDSKKSWCSTLCPNTGIGKLFPYLRGSASNTIRTVFSTSAGLPPSFYVHGTISWNCTCFSQPQMCKTLCVCMFATSMHCMWSNHV